MDSLAKGLITQKVYVHIIYTNVLSIKNIQSQWEFVILNFFNIADIFSVMVIKVIFCINKVQLRYTLIILKFDLNKV